MFLKKISLLLLIVSLGSCMYKVPPGNVGLKVNTLGSKQGEIEVYDVGRYWQGINTEWYRFPFFIQNYIYPEPFKFPINGGLVITLSLGVEFNLEHDKISDIFQRYRYGVDEIRNVVIRKEILNSLQKFSADYDIDSFLEGGTRELIQKVNEDVQQKFGPQGINIVQVTMSGEPVYPEEIRRAIIAKIQATQNAVTRENELREAEAEAKKKMAQADGEAQSMLIRARAEAEANKLRQATLTENLLRQQWIEKWNGKLPEVISEEAMIYGRTRS